MSRQLSADMYAIVRDALILLEPMSIATDGLPVLREATPELVSSIAHASQLKHARYCGLASAMGEIVVRELLSLARGKRRALFTAGVDPHKEIAQKFGDRLAEAGPRRLNPIMFPHTLPSATAVTLAAQFQAHTCALAFDGSNGLYTALSTASLLFEADQVDEVLVYVCSADSNNQGSTGGQLFGLGLLLSQHPLAYRYLAVTRISRTTLSCHRAQASVNKLSVDARAISKLCIQLLAGDTHESMEISGFLFDPST